MFSRGPACLRSSRGLTTFLDNIAIGADEHHEPLLFLYPRWFTFALRQHRRSIALIAGPATTSLAKGNRQPSRLFVGRCYARRRSVGSSLSRRWLSSNTAVAKDNGNKNSDAVIEDGLRNSAEHTAVAAGTRHSSGSSNTTSTPHPERGATDLTGSGLTGDVGENSRERSLEYMERLPTWDRRKLRYRLHINKEVQKLEPWKQRRRTVHWTQLLDQLEDLQAQSEDRMLDKPGTKHREILVPEETVVYLAGMTGMRENIWYVPIHNGCRVRVLDAIESDGPCRKVVLSGSERVVELVANEISQAQNLQATGDPLIDVRKPPVRIYPSIEALRLNNLPVPLIRGVWESHDELSERPVFMDSILPSHLTLTNVREFSEYVEDISRSKRYPRFSQKYDSTHPERHHHLQRAEKALVELFRQDENKRLISTGALNIALSFLCKHEFLSSAREVFSKAEHLATADTFNILLRSAARRQDLANFRDILTEMAGSHVQPNADTWLAFIDCVVFPPAKKYLVERLISSGYLSSIRGRRTLFLLTVEDTFLEHLERGQSVDSFFDKMGASEGTDWVNGALLYKMFSVIVRLKNYEALDRLIDISLHHGWPMGNSTPRLVLGLFRSNIFSALHFVLRCIGSPSFQMNDDAYEKLFLIAFKARSYNVCRVLWRYACMEGRVSYKMRQSVLTSLVRNEPQKRKNVIADLWSVSAGKVIVGMDLHLPDIRLPQSILEYIPPEYHEYPLSYLLSGYKPMGNERDTQLRFGSDLVSRDIKVGPRYEPQESLALMLHAAAFIDHEWNNTPRPTHWMIQNAIQVPVVKRLRSRW